MIATGVFALVLAVSLVLATRKRDDSTRAADLLVDVTRPEIDAALQARKDLSDGEKARAATYLNSAEAVRILERVEEPEAVVAIGLVKAREMDLDEALKGLSTVQKIEARIYLSNEQIERERANKRDLGRDKGHGLDF